MISKILQENPCVVSNSTLTHVKSKIVVKGCCEQQPREFVFQNNNSALNNSLQKIS